MKKLLITFILIASATAQSAPAKPSTGTPVKSAAPANTAQAGNAESNQASLAEVNELLTLLRSRQAMQSALESLREQIKRGQMQGFELALKKKGVTLTPEERQRAQKRLDAISDEMLAQMPYDEMMTASAEIYRKHFSSGDIKALVAFYSSPSGQKFLTEMPTLLQESMRAGSDIMMKRMPEIMDRIEKRQDELTEEFTKNPPAPKQPAPAPKQP